MSYNTQFFKWIVPIVKENVKPIAKQVGREALKTAANIANDTINGENLEQSAKKRIAESINKIGDQKGNGSLNLGYKRKRKLPKSSSFPKKIKKRKLKKLRETDIFDN